MDDFAKRGEVAIISRQVSSELPDTLDGGELLAVGRQKQQTRMRSVLTQERTQENSVMVTSVVEHEDHAATPPAVAQQPLEKALLGLGVEDLALVRTSWPVLTLTAPKRAMDLRVGACSGVGP